MLFFICPKGFPPMAMICDNHHFYNRMSDHDAIMAACALWVDHYNFMLSIPWNTEADNAMFQEEMIEYLCYDV
jgi:sensor domain CHASE-containing protein